VGGFLAADAVGGLVARLTRPSADGKQVMSLLYPLIVNNTVTAALNTTAPQVTIEGARTLLITSWYPADRGGTGAVVLPPNGACWLEMPTGGPDGGDPR